MLNTSKYYLFLFVILFFSSSPLFSQNFILKGTIVDSSGQKIPYANVVLKKPDSSIVKGTVSRDNGTFQFEIYSGKYLISISFIGYEESSKLIDITNHLDLGDIVLSEKLNQLSEVILTAKKPLITRKIDRLVFNVGGRNLFKGGDAFDVLERTPGLLVSEEGIKLFGKSEMKVMINSRITILEGQDLIQYLKSLGSNEIESVEVITTPPAKYDADGQSGLINIKLKTARMDFFGGRISGTYEIGKEDSKKSGANITYNKNKLSIFSSLGLSKNKRPTELQEIYDYPNSISSQTDFDVLGEQNLLTYRGGLDFEISDKSITGISYIYTGQNNKSTENSNNTNTERINSDIVSVISGNRLSRNKKYNHAISTYYELKIDTANNNKMTIFLDYFNHNRDGENQTTGTTFDANDIVLGSYGIRNEELNELSNISSNIDFDLTTKSNLILNCGAKIAFTSTNNRITNYNFANDVFDRDEPDDFEYDENLQALYFSIKKELSKKITFSTGLRYELVQTSGRASIDESTIDNDYHALYPTLYLKYSTNENNVFTLSAGKRVLRPHYQILNPTPQFSTQFDYSVGNPFLQPSNIYNVEVAHSYKNNLNMSISYYSYKDLFAEIVKRSETDFFRIYTRENFRDSYGINSEISYSFEISNWFSGYAYLYGAYSSSKYGQEIADIPETDGFEYSIGTNNSFYLNNDKTTVIEFNGFYNSPFNSEGGKISNQYSVDIGFNTDLIKKKLSLNVLASALIDGNDFEGTNVVNNIGSYQYIRRYARKLRLTLSYKFDGSNVKERDRKTSNENERNRFD